MAWTETVTAYNNYSNVTTWTISGTSHVMQTGTESPSSFLCTDLDLWRPLDVTTVCRDVVVTGAIRDRYPRQWRRDLTFSSGKRGTSVWDWVGTSTRTATWSS